MFALLILPRSAIVDPAPAVAHDFVASLDKGARKSGCLSNPRTTASTLIFTSKRLKMRINRQQPTRGPYSNADSTRGLRLPL